MTQSSTAGGNRSTGETTAERDAGRGWRVATAALGATLLGVGLRRRSRAGTAAALAGGWLLYRSAAGGNRRSGGSQTPTSGEHDAETQGEAESEPSAEAPTVERSITVAGDPDELYRYWRDADLLSRVVGDAAQIGAAGEHRHRWSVPGPLGRRFEWETELVEDRPGELLRWRSDDGAALPNEGTVRFRPAPADRGTEVTLELRVDPPGGRVGRRAMGALGVVPETLAETTLDRFKSLAETGEIPTLERNPSGRGRGDLL